MSHTSQDLVQQLSFGLPDRLAKALDVSGVTSGQMAERLGVSRTTVSNYIHGRTNPTRSVRRDWALMTGIPLEWIETGHISDHSPDGTPVMARLRRAPHHRHSVTFLGDRTRAQHVDMLAA